MRVRFGAWLGLLGAAALGCNQVEPQSVTLADRETSAPSVVLVTIDTLRADHVGAYGAAFARTPTLDALAARGVRFETVIAATPITLPSHASILTGLHPPRHAVRHNGTFQLGDGPPTLAERFRAAGFATGAVVGAVVLDERHGLDRGFDHYDDRLGGRKAGSAGYLERTATEVSDAAIAWLGSVGTRPFFLWIHYYDPHRDHRAPAAFAQAQPGRGYDAEIAYVDHELGRFLAELEARGLRDRTVVAVTSDHGESLGEHGEADHGLSLYDAALRVPWLLAGPGVPEGALRGGVARNIDVAPTLLSLAGAPPLPDPDGRDLSAPDASGPDWAYMETLLPKLDYGWAPLHAIRTGEHLYVRAPRRELYVLADDPQQLHDRSGDPSQRERLAELDARIDAVLAVEASGADRLALDPDARARLQALGYALPARAVAETGLDPKDGLRHQALIQRGARALDETRYEEAEAALRAFLVHAPKSPRAHGLLASTLLYAGRPAEALEHADLAVALDPAPAHRYADRAEIRAVLGDRAGARRDFERAAEIDPDDAWVAMGSMWIRAGEGDLRGAATHARRAFARAPKDAFVRFRVGMIWREARAYHAARESFEAAVRLRPDFAMAQLHLAIEYARVGRLDAAHAHREQAGALVHDATLGSELALALAAAGDSAAAAELIAELGRRHPGADAVVRAQRRLAAHDDAEAPAHTSRKEGT